MKKAIYPGSFDPLTFGHLDIINRASKIVDELVVGVLNNSAKNSLFSLEERVSMIEEMTKDSPNITVASFDGLLVDFMNEIHATIIVRGLRAVTDFEYELQIAQANHVQDSEIETIFLTSDLKYSYLSSQSSRNLLPMEETFPILYRSSLSIGFIKNMVTDRRFSL